MIGELGDLEPVDPREIWPREAYDFTPWLAENLDRLGAILGLELELETSEAGVGTFSLDLLARDLGTDRLVVIENQFGATDHDHLGKLLTYASGLDGGVGVWVGEDFREEHRQALDWLNQKTDDGTHFFGVTIEVFRVDRSRPAVTFRLVAKPNQWQKIQRKRGAAAVSERSERYRAYFQELIDELREEHRFTNARIGQPQNWYSFSAGMSGISFGASFTRGDRIRTELYIGTGDEDLNQKLYSWLLQERSEIESEFGEELSWESLEDRLASRIAVYREGSIDSSAEELEEIRAWHIASLLKFRDVFRKRLDRFRTRL